MSSDFITSRQLENLHFAKYTISFGVWPRDHYKAFQWFPLACSVPTEVSPEVLVQITKGPLLCCVVFRRVQSFIHAFPTRRIPRLVSTTYYAKSYPYKAHGCTIFMGARAMNQSLDLGMIIITGFQSPPNIALNCQNPPNTVPNPSPQILFSTLVGSNNHNIDRDDTSIK
jgi:hypothetical protein